MRLRDLLYVFVLVNRHFGPWRLMLCDQVVLTNLQVLMINIGECPRDRLGGTPTENLIHY
jgi:hypothetical protein